MLQYLIDQLNYYRRTALNPNPGLEPQRCLDQAYGMVQMFITIYPNFEAEVVELWNTEYLPEFERALYGSL
jgi:hypothetical protein